MPGAVESFKTPKSLMEVDESRVGKRAPPELTGGGPAAAPKPSVAVAHAALARQRWLCWVRLNPEATVLGHAVHRQAQDLR